MLQKPLQHQEHGFGQTVKDMYVGSLDTRNMLTTQATVIHDEYLVRMCVTSCFYEMLKVRSILVWNS